MAEKKKKNKKTKKNKEFIRNILIGIIGMLIVAFIINVAPGYKRDKYKDITNLVMADENITEKLKHIIYINEDGTIYMSKDDIANLIDKTIYYDEDSNTVVTTSRTRTASMKIGEKEININGSTIKTLDEVIYLNGIMYIPISELESVYNIKTEYKRSSNIIIIDDLNKGMITAELSENTKMKYRPRRLSKKMENLEQSERVYAFYTTSKGWRLIRTEDGTIGYVKANTLTNEYILRQDMNNTNQANKINLDIQSTNIQQVEGQNIIVKDLFSASLEGITLKDTNTTAREQNAKVWSNISFNKNLSLKDYNKRAEIVSNIVSLAYSSKINGINIIVNEDIENIDRLIIELTPRLREMGISTNLLLNERISEDKYKEVVDYLIINK